VPFRHVPLRASELADVGNASGVCRDCAKRPLRNARFRSTAYLGPSRATISVDADGGWVTRVNCYYRGLFFRWKEE
jgi:hypothetical protein